MKKIGIFYGSTTGYTADLADRIAKALGVETADVYDTAKTAPSAIADYETLIFGASTWGAGDMQENMEEFLDGVQAMALPGKKIAFFGCGDETMAETFGNALEEMKEKLKDTGATFVGEFNTDGYSYDKSASVTDGVSVGLIIDEVNHPDLTDAKIKEWVKAISD